jgi:hypothetical protein
VLRRKFVVVYKRVALPNSERIKDVEISQDGCVELSKCMERAIAGGWRVGTPFSEEYLISSSFIGIGLEPCKTL